MSICGWFQYIQWQRDTSEHICIRERLLNILPKVNDEIKSREKDMEIIIN